MAQQDSARNGISGGYNSKILRINLSDRTVKPEALNDTFCRMYIGGAGFAAYYLWKELKQGIDALGPENKLVLALGPVSGLVLPGAARNCIGAKSPLTGGIAKSEVGGFWASELKRAGFDAIIVEGKSEKPVYLWVHDGEAEIKDASRVWGKETLETQTAIRTELKDERVQLVSIGPGGENLVRYACIMVGTRNAAGRGGLGAVMGSKNLKAIAVRGHRVPPVADEERLKDIRNQVLSYHNPISDFGTGGPEMLPMELNGNLPVRNFRSSFYPELKNITTMGMKEKGILTGMEGCFACAIRCKKVVKVEGSIKVNPAYGGPEYETLAAVGSDCGIGNPEIIAKGNELCNAYSLDTISTGSTIAFAMECFEKGLLTKEDCGGMDLRWGNGEAMLNAIELIARRNGIGALLAEGTLRMAKRIGKNSCDFAVHVKGLEPGMHEPRIKPGLALSFMLSQIGADHCGGIMEGMITNPITFKQYNPLGWVTPFPPAEFGPRKVGIFRIGQFNSVIGDSMVVCAHPNYDLTKKAEILRAVTGWDTGPAELLRVAERIVTTMRLINTREGIAASQDILPERLLQPKMDGPLASIQIDRTKYDKARKYYYTLMGWDKEGIPLPEKVEELYIE